MPTPTISNEVALRIALASKELPNLSVRDLIEALQTYGEMWELTESFLNKLTVTQLQEALTDLDENYNHLDACQEAVRMLWGETDDLRTLLPIEAVAPEAIQNSIKIAVASNNGEELDGHFGSCHRYLIYQLSVDQIHLIDARSTVKADLAKDKSSFRVDLIRDCAIVYFVSIGGPAAAKVIQANIYPMKVETGGKAREVLSTLQSAIATSPPPWLAKLLGQKQEMLDQYQN